MYGRGPGGDRYSWVPTQAPLDSDFDAVTYTNYTGFEKLDEDDEVRELREEEVVGGIPEAGFGAVNGLAGGGRESEYWVQSPAGPSSSSRNDDNHGYHYNRQAQRHDHPQSPRVQSPRQHRTHDFESRYTSASRSPERSRTIQNGGDSSMARYEILRSPTQRSTASRTDRRGQSNGYHKLSSEQDHSRNGHAHPPAPASTSQPRPTKRNRAESTPARYKPKSQSQPQSKGRAITNGHTNGNQSSRPPAKQQSYEVVKSRVLEDTPEKTVTISTWRERVANEMNGYGPRNGRESEVEMSVYYVNAEDYVDESDGRVIEVDQRTRSLSRSRSKSRTAQPVEWMGSKSPRLKKGRLSSESRKGKERAFDAESEVPRSHIRDRVLTPWPSATELGEIVEDGVDDDPLLKHQRSRSLPMHLPDWEYDNPRQADRTLPRTSTPVRGRHPNDDASERMMVPRPISLLPTREGSTISSIRGPGQSSSSPRPSASTQPSSVQALDVVLGSCEPSLIHLAPILTDLGIKTEEHLRAVAKLSEATRDRELKEVAFKRGVTVVEWAILLDKLRALSL
ncbi:hypothetical protein Moror_2296 [Moniliophthora roreri MCA 2997]|uniref:Uncharacterized protein n=2 Tax=Moniliophthora roreri TaxID=221103 RepID=V2X0D8_MONRO|nr:hypothetical protein Moror_2296 [Moniliophthora roreri MCA 2997]